MTRSALYVAGLAWRRLRRRDGGALLAAAGIAAGAALVAGVLVASTVARDRSVSQAVERLPDASRAVRAVWFGVPQGRGEEHRALDRAVRETVPELGLGEPTPLVLFRESTVAGRFVGLAAVDGLAAHVRLTAGRLPRSCRPERCEVVRLRGAGRLPDAPGLRLVEVGRAALPSRGLFGDFLAPTDNALAEAQLAPALREAAGYHRPPPAPLVLAEGVRGLVSSPAVAAVYRSYAWVWPVRPGAPRAWEVDALVGRVERARAALAARSSSFAVTAPEEELREAERSASAAARRLLLVGGEAAALLLAFAVLAARSLRRDLEAARTRLGWYGARRWQLALLTGLEGVLVAVPGALAGLAAGVLAGAAGAAAAGAPVGAVLAETLLSPAGLGTAAAAAAAAAAVVAGVLWAGGGAGRRAGAVDAGALASLAVAAALLAGGVADEERLAEGDGAFGLLLLPALLAFAAAVAAARLLPLLARALGGLPRVSLPLRLACLSLARGPGAAAAAVAFLTLAFALAALAEGYRATLSRAEADAAAFRVPLDVVVREDLTRLVPVLEAAPPEAFARLGPGVEAEPVVRLRASAGRAEHVTGVTLLGIPPDVLPRLRGWRGGWAREPRAALAERIRAGGDGRLTGIDVPAGSRTLALPAGRTLLGVTALFETAAGRAASAPLERRGPRLEGAVPAEARGGRLVALRLDPPRLVERGADAGVALRGELRVGPVSFDGGPPVPLAGWVGDGGVEALPAGRGLAARHAVTPGRVARLRARQPTDGSPPLVLATPRLAELAGGPGGLLPVAAGGGTITVRVADVVERVPGAEGDVLVGDAAAIRVAVGTETVGAGRPNEIWLEVPGGAAGAVETALARPPFRALESVSRRALEADARRDPLARGTLVALLAAAGIALALAVAGLVLAVRADLRDDRGELLDLESQGAPPSTLARVVRARALVVAGAGLVAGGAAGLALLLLVTRVVTVTARAGAAEPPLAADVDPVVLLAGAAAFAAASWALLRLATRRPLGGPGPEGRRA